MNKTDFILYRRWYDYLSNLDAKRFCLNNHFVEGNVSDLGKRKVFSYSKAGPDGYLAVIFPQWTFIENGIPILKENSSGLVYDDMATFFGISSYEARQISVAKNYNTRPTLELCLRRIYAISKAYGHTLTTKE